MSNVCHLFHHLPLLCHRHTTKAFIFSPLSWRLLREKNWTQHVTNSLMINWTVPILILIPLHFN